MTEGGTHRLYRPGSGPRPRGDGAPTGHGLPVMEARRGLADYLDANLSRPLYVSDVARAADLETALDTMTLAERVYLEIEMQSRAKVMFSAD